MNQVCQYHDEIRDNIYSLKEDIAVIKNDISTIKDRLDRMDVKLNNTAKKSASLATIPIKDIVLYILVIIIGAKMYGVV